MPWAGPSARGSNNGSGGAGGDGGRHAKGANARRRQLAPEPYSLGHLRVLFQRLIDAQEGKVEGETTVVETLRGEREEKKQFVSLRGTFVEEGWDGRRICPRALLGVEDIVLSWHWKSTLCVRSFLFHSS